MQSTEGSLDVESRQSLHVQSGSKEVQGNEKLVTQLSRGEGNLQTISMSDSRLHKSFTDRQIHIISLGSNIGSGLFISTGAALRFAGPGNMILGYGIVCTLVVAMLNTVAEMTIAFPESGNFISYADRWVDPALSFAVGFAEWLGWVTVVAAEAVFFNVLVNFWADDSVHQAVWLTVFIVIVGSIFILPNRWFAWFEYVTSVLKIIAFLIVVIASICILAGAGPRDIDVGGHNWKGALAFKNSFAGFSTCSLYALWAMGDQVFTGIMAGEAHNPRLSMSHATKLVPYRVTIVYMTTILLISFLVPMDNESLFGGSGTAASPYVVGMMLAGVKGLPDFLNVVIIIGITSVAAESIYIASRILRAMSAQGHLPRFISHVDRHGRPTWSLAITITTAFALTYINLSNTGIEIFTWLASICSSSFFMVWIMISITSFRFRAALKAQADPLFTQQWAYKTSLWPYMPAWLLTGSTLLLICCIYQGAGRGSGFSAYTFFQYMLGVCMIIISYVGYKVIFKTKFRDPYTADLHTGRAVLSKEQLGELEKYKSMSRNKRFGTYIKLW